MVKKKNLKNKRKTFYEYFRIKKHGKVKTIKIKGTEKISPGSKKQVAQENRILKNLFFGIFLIILVGLLLWRGIGSISELEYEGVDFKMVKEGQILLYNTALPVIYNGQKVRYNFYLRNDPRKLSKISFEGNLVFKDNMVINSTEDFHCEGRGIIAVANILNLYEVIGTKVIKDESATCDSQGRYVYLNILPGNETRVEQFGPACYNIYINDCEILEGTERFMLETFVELQEII